MCNLPDTMQQDRLSNGKGEIGFEFSFAFQPIVNAETREIISFEALVRGPHGEPSAWVFAQVPSNRIARFDEVCRWKAINLASHLRIAHRLNLNMSAHALYQIDMTITATFNASIESGIPVRNIVFEVLEDKSMTDRENLLQYLRVIRDFGFKTAFDDFGAGYSGLNLLVEYQPNYIKLDRHLIGNIHQNPVMQSIVLGIRKICDQLSIEIVAEGVEQAGEYQWLREMGIRNFQGYYFARPVFEALPDVANRVFC
ncbi:MAG TPA: EAL domain-containing protein [Anaerolineales bacterium]|nr:EAL domain-containing protein [Anaerolineales bacterium]